MKAVRDHENLIKAAVEAKKLAFKAAKAMKEAGIKISFEEVEKEEVEKEEGKKKPKKK